MPEEFNHFIRHLRLEALSLAMLMFTLTYVSGVPAWVSIVVFPIYDVGMLGYLHGPRLGAATYNTMHNATIPTFCIMIGALTHSTLISVIGFTWTFHIAVDRVLGFGLKYKTSFYRTHLGEIAAKGTLSLLQSSSSTVVQSSPVVAPTQQYSASPRSPSEPQQ